VARATQDHGIGPCVPHQPRHPCRGAQSARLDLSVEQTTLSTSRYDIGRSQVIAYSILDSDASDAAKTTKTTNFCCTTRLVKPLRHDFVVFSHTRSESPD
jgi:hypothetical protein